MTVYGSDWIGIEAVLMLLPLIFFIHDGEEIATVEKWLRNRRDRPRIGSELRLLNMEKRITIQFAIAVLLLGSVLCIVSWFAVIRAGGGNVSMLFVGIVAVLLLDGIKHVGASLAMKTYTPGVVTAALVEIPYAAYTLYRLFGEGKTDVLALACGTLIALPLALILVWAGLLLGKIAAPDRKVA